MRRRRVLKELAEASQARRAAQEEHPASRGQEPVDNALSASLSHSQSSDAPLSSLLATQAAGAEWEPRRSLIEALDSSQAQSQLFQDDDGDAGEL